MTDSWRSWLVMKCGEMKPCSIWRPSTNSVSSAMDLPSSTVMTPSLPTFSMTSAMRSPMRRSFPAMPATAATVSLPSTGEASPRSSPVTTRWPCSRPRRIAMGLAPAAMTRMPSEKIACASTVAVVVPSPAISLVRTATCFTSCAPMFSKRSLSSISLATVTPSLVMTAGP